jgi:TrmH family RNA methyltransferase
MTRCSNTSFLSSLVSNPRSTKPLAAFLTRLVEDRAERDRTNLFYCDGIRFVHHAAGSRHVCPKLFVYSPPTARRHPGIPITMERIRERHPTVPMIPLPPEILARLSQSPEPQGIGAVMEQTWTPLYRLSPDAGLCYVAIDTVQNPGNFGTILRTLEAVGGAGVICLPPAEPDTPPVDPFAPNVVRAGMGATFALRFARTGGQEWRNWREKHGVRLVGTSPHTGKDFRSVRYGNRTALWMGGERKGLTEEQMAQCDDLVRIPMAPTATADSLNLAMATSILLYELFNQAAPVKD